jgi:hypothetical protein
MQETDVTDKNWDIQVNGGNLKFYEVNDARSVFSEKVTFEAGGNVGIEVTDPTQKLDVGGNVRIRGTVSEEGISNNKTYRYRTGNSSSWSGGTKAAKFGRFYWTPAHWSSTAPVAKITIQSKYYTGVSRTYMVQAGYQDDNVVINQLEVNDLDTRTALLVGPKTSAGYNYAGQPVYYVDLSMVFASYMWGWAQVESQVPFLTANPTTTWGGIVMDATLTQPNTSVTFPASYPTFVAGNVGIGTTSPAQKLHIKSTTSGPTGIIIENTNNSQSLDLDFWSNGGSAQGRIRYEEGSGSFAISPNVGTPNAMYINYSNKVGIGTTSPAARLDLDRKSVV